MAHDDGPDPVAEGWKRFWELDERSRRALAEAFPHLREAARWVDAARRALERLPVYAQHADVLREHLRGLELAVGARLHGSRATDAIRDRPSVTQVLERLIAAEREAVDAFRAKGDGISANASELREQAFVEALEAIREAGS